MFTWLKQWWHTERINKWLEQAYDPLFAVRSRLEYERSVLILTLEFLIDLQKDLQLADNKTEEQIVKERWKALKIDAILEHYRIAILKLNEAIDNMPSDSRLGTVVFTNDL